jgi:hypothetical protein
MRKNTLNKTQTVSATGFNSRGDVIPTGNMADTVTSLVTCIQFLDNIGIQINIDSGTADGTFEVQVSADYQTLGPTNDVINTGNWITLTSATVTSGSPNPIYFNLDQISAPFIQLVYVPTSGSGTFDAYIVGKSI